MTQVSRSEARNGSVVSQVQLTVGAAHLVGLSTLLTLRTLQGRNENNAAKPATTEVSRGYRSCWSGGSLAFNPE